MWGTEWLAPKKSESNSGGVIIKKKDENIIISKAEINETEEKIGSLSKTLLKG